MQHHEADQTLAVERYLLGDMSPAELDNFEEHLFVCPKCAESVKAGATFVENARAVFKEPATEAGKELAPQSIKWEAAPWWRRLMGPAWAPALAALALLCIAGYQQFIVIPGLRTQLAQVTAPQPLVSFALHAASRGAPRTTVVPANANFFDLYFDVATESASGYSCAVLGSSGHIIFTEHLPLPRQAGGGTLHLLVGRSSLPAGDYTLVVSTESSPTMEIGRYAFKVEYQ